ncbi:hypothetical protein BDY19DRAFT_1018301 [Irpex rosettiformis]|uniref:Uncharacterized protein n=1 Tax=Irpex rosettiformis TaxID=378272 RepID=A0ACB8TVQ3_9APHY|nr:hypothetical protein BDY19DRAFT_1018301 [Irpex rosettiformis]
MAASIFALSQPWTQSTNTTTSARRLSITSSSSSSAVSLSSILESRSALSSSASASGSTLTGSDYVSDSYATPPPSTTASLKFPASSPPFPADQPIVLGIPGRPKTSHTTIERRYRTNLFARITGLKQAVPALRVLEVKNGAVSLWNDRFVGGGFVDGVKVTRKMTKANVLGKATEYIRVVKKREARLKRKQDGLKSLVSGLVGGLVLSREWECEWWNSLGGKNEIESDDLTVTSDVEDADEGDSDADNEEGFVRKKVGFAKPSVIKKEKAPPPPPTQQQQAGMLEKDPMGTMIVLIHGRVITRYPSILPTPSMETIFYMY